MSESTVQHRRSKGRGTRRADGRWMTSYTARDVDGQPLRQTLYARSQRELQDKLVAALRERNVGAVTARRGRGPTVAALCEDWLAGMEARGLRPRTIRRYREVIDQHITPALGSTPLATLQPAQIDHLLAAKRRAGLSPRTLAYIRGSLRTALYVAMRRGLVARNVAALAEPVQQVKTERPILTPEQARSLLQAGAEDRDGPLWVLALATGARQGELLGLRWSDVDWERHELHIIRTLERMGGDYRLAETKTERSRRTVRLPGIALGALQRRRALQAEDRLHAGAHWQPRLGDLIFTTTTGGPLLDTAVSRHFQRRLRALGVPVVRFHDLRHFVGTHLLGTVGVSVREVADQLGHSQTSTTLNVYAHAMPGAQAVIADAIDEMLEPRR